MALEYPKTWESFPTVCRLLVACKRTIQSAAIDKRRNGLRSSSSGDIDTARSHGLTQATKVSRSHPGYQDQKLSLILHALPWCACCVTLHCNMVIPGALSPRSFCVFWRCSPLGPVNPVSDWPVSKIFQTTIGPFVLRHGTCLPGTLATFRECEDKMAHSGWVAQWNKDDKTLHLFGLEHNCRFPTAATTWTLRQRTPTLSMCQRWVAQFRNPNC